MGLGKTISLLALVCSSLDILDDQKLIASGDASRCTLISHLNLVRQAEGSLKQFLI